MFTMICANIHTVSHTAHHIKALVAAFICFSSPRAIISWYPFQIINQKQASQIVNHRYLFTRDIVLYIERCPSICTGLWENSPPVCHLRVQRVTAFVLDRNTMNNEVSIHIILSFFIFGYINYLNKFFKLSPFLSSV